MLLAVVSVLAAGVALVMLLASQPPGDDSAEAGFARDMIVHHGQAVQMAEIVRDKTESDAIRLLASDISLGQQGQIGIMQGWLQVWGLRITGSEPAMAWMGHPTEGLMPGMAAPDEIDRLSELPPDRADVLFLRLMIAHHEAAIPMSQAVLKRTDQPEVSRLAKDIIAAQKAEIENMKAMVTKRVGDSAEVDLEPANGSGTKGTATLSKSRRRWREGLAECLGTPWLWDDVPGAHPSRHLRRRGGGPRRRRGRTRTLPPRARGSEEIEYPLSPVDPNAKGKGTSTTVVHHVALEGLLSETPMHVNVHKPGSGEPPPVTCANLNEAV